MIYDRVMVRYGELTLKGKNKRVFIDTLANNIYLVFKDMDELSFEKQFDRFYINITENSNLDEIINRLKEIPGIHNFSFVKKVDKDIEKIKETALLIVKDTCDDLKTFKVKTSRTDKSFNLISDEINRQVATIILKNTNLSVDVHNPDVEVRVEIRLDAAYISVGKIDGLGGLPLGSSGKGLLMISGGIDSPVAGYLVMKRGIKIEAIHFQSPPYTSDMALYKVKKLLSKLAKIQGQIKFINIPFTKLQLAIYEACGDKYAITLMRRMMYRIASRVAQKEKCECIISGESIGQVASQTLTSLVAINNVTNMPVIRPLAIYDKLDIINISKNIDTYETSILPYEDCCTIFDPKNPTTKPHIHDCEYFESKFDFESLIDEAINNATIETITVDF